MSLKSIPVFITALCLAGGAGATSTAGGWEKIGSSEGMVWHAKNGSGAFTNVSGNKENGYSLVIQSEDLANKNSVYNLLVVRYESCRKGYGYAILNDLKGNFAGKSPFVRFGPKAADMLGSYACKAWDDRTGTISGTENPDDWQLVVETAKQGAKFFLKTDTVQRTTYQGKPAITALYRYHNERTSTLQHYKYIIPAFDCQKGLGKAFAVEFDGTPMNQADFVVQGNTALSIVATGLCGKLAQAR